MERWEQHAGIDGKGNAGPFNPQVPLKSVFLNIGFINSVGFRMIVLRQSRFLFVILYSALKHRKVNRRLYRGS